MGCQQEDLIGNLRITHSSCGQSSKTVPVNVVQLLPALAKFTVGVETASMKASGIIYGIHLKLGPDCSSD